MSEEEIDNQKEIDKREEERKERYRKSMLQAHVSAYIKRGLNAGIPEQYLRIGPEDFNKLLSWEYHSDEPPKKGKRPILPITEFIYKKPFDLLKIPFIIIDGGNIKSRKVAAFAIMFRLITCDKFAKFYSCGSVVHKLNTFDAKDVSSGDRRTDFANILKEYNVVCLSEFDPTLFKEKLEGGHFMDEILDARCNSVLPTIITFQDVLNSTNAFNHKICGTYLAEMSHKDKLKNNPSEDYLRIRVRSL